MNKSLSNLLKKYYVTKGNQTVFNEIFMQCNGIINSAANSYRYKDDMRQEAIIKIFTLLEEHKLDKLVGEEDSKIFGYIKRAIVNHLRDVYRKDYLFIDQETATLSSELENMCGIIEVFGDVKSRLEELLEDLIKTLTKKQKEVMRLLYLDELTEVEIAKYRNVHRQDINKIKNRAQKAIKANLTLKHSGADQTPLY